MQFKVSKAKALEEAKALREAGYQIKIDAYHNYGKHLAQIDITEPGKANGIQMYIIEEGAGDYCSFMTLLDSFGLEQFTKNIPKDIAPYIAQVLTDYPPQTCDKIILESYKLC